MKRKILAILLYISGLDRLFEMFSRGNLYLVGYHSISSDENRDELAKEAYLNVSIKDKDFEEHLLFLKKTGHTFINFSQLKNGNVFQYKKPTIIFFDDGFKDNLVNVLPILRRHNIPATVFVSCGFIDKTNFLRTIEIRILLLKGEKMDKEKVEAEILKIKEMSRSDQLIIISDLRKKFPDIELPEVFLDWDDVNCLSNNNFEIGSHGISHEKFTELNSEELEEELIGSKKKIESKIGKKIDILSYPKGRFNKGIISVVAKSGYRFAISTKEGFNSADYILNHPYELKRIAPKPREDLINFRARLYGFSFLHSLLEIISIQK